MTLKNKKEVIKHSGSIQISNEVSLLQRRAWNVLLANAFNELDRKEIFKVSIKDLSEVLEYDSKDINYLKETLKLLNKTQIEWNILGKDNNEWGVATLLAEVRIVNNICEYEYSPSMRERLYNPKMYAKISLSLQNKFDSKYTLALYELFVDYYIAKNDYGETPWISIENFKKLLGLKKEDYPDFKIINRNIIKKSLKEINSKSDLLIEIEYQKQSRKITALKFYIKKNPKSIIDLEPLIKSSKEEQQLLPIPEFEIENQQLFQTLLGEFNVSTNEAIEVLKIVDEFKIKDSLEYVRQCRDNGKIKDNIGGFTIQAIKGNWKIDSLKKEKIEKKTKYQRIKELTTFIKQLDEEVETQRNESFTTLKEKLSPKQFKTYELEFKTRLDKNEYNDFIKNSYHKNGLEGSGVKASFNYLLKEKLLPPKIEELRKYAQSKGYDYDKLTKELKELEK